MTDRPPDDDRQRTNMIALAAVAVLVVITVVLMIALHHGIRHEECLAGGHSTCAGEP